MSPRPDRPRRRGGEQTPAPPRAAGSRRPRALPWLALALFLAALIAVLAIHPWKKAPPPDPLAGVSALAAADTADALVTRGKFFEALPWIERVERLSQGTDAGFELRAATVDNNATIQVRVKRGLAIPSTRSSVERVALIRQSLRRSARAEEMTADPAIRSALVAARAGQLAVWGFAREAYAEYRRAALFAPLAARPLSEARWMEKMLGDPTSTAPLAGPATTTSPVAGDTATAAR